MEDRATTSSRAGMPVTDQVRQPFGLVHGGALLTLAESLTSFGTWVGVKDDGKVAMGQEINASLMRPITEGHVNGTATARRRGPHRLGLGGRDHRRRGRLCALSAPRSPSATPRRVSPRSTRHLRLSK